MDYTMVNKKDVSVSVDVILFTVQGEDLKVLLIQRKIEPFKDNWAIPGGFVKIEESLENAAKRELMEEAGVSDVYLEQLYTFGEPKRDPRGRVITVAYFALVDFNKINVKSGSDAQDTKWFSMFKLPKLAFDHKQILHYALERLRYKLGYTTVGFQLMPKKFTLSELQKLYETILDKSLDKRNFRKKMFSLNILEKTNESKREGAHRPAKLYRFKDKFLVFGRDIV